LQRYYLTIIPDVSLPNPGSEPCPAMVVEAGITACRF
jgi:hypothetical protein